MRVRVTASARRHLHEAVIRLRRRHPDTAATFVESVEHRLRRLADEPDDAPFMGPPAEAVCDRDHHRFFYRVRGDTVWVLAMWTGDEPLPGAG